MLENSEQVQNDSSACLCIRTKFAAPFKEPVEIRKVKNNDLVGKHNTTGGKQYTTWVCLYINVSWKFTIVLSSTANVFG